MVSESHKSVPYWVPGQDEWHLFFLTKNGSGISGYLNGGWESKAGKKIRPEESVEINKKTNGENLRDKWYDRWVDKRGRE